MNDNTPQFVGVTPYLLNISELTLVSYPQFQDRLIIYYISLYKFSSNKNIFLMQLNRDMIGGE